MAIPQSRQEQEEHDAESRRQLLAVETTALALLLARRKRAVDDALRRNRDPRADLFVGIRDSIVDARAAARHIALLRLIDQLGVSLPNDSNARAVDILRANQIARTQAEALARLSESTPGKLPLARRWAQALGKHEARVATTAATETFSAASAEREAAARRGAELYRLELLRVWDATLDKRTCPVCSALDGTIVGIRELFPGGVEPGRAHARCRCWETILRGTGRGNEITFKPVSQP